MIPLAPTADDCARLEALLARRYGARVVDKASSPVARAIAQALAIAGLMPAATFIERFATTIPMFAATEVGDGIVAIARALGVPVPEAVHDALVELAGTARSLVMVPAAWAPETRWDVLVHEGAHAAEIARDGAVTFAAAYLASDVERACIEARAYGTAMELAHLRGQPLPGAEQLAEHLHGYAVGADAMATAVDSLRSWARSVEAGARSPVVAAVVEEWGA